MKSEIPSQLLASLVLSATRALRDQTPETLLAYSCTIDMEKNIIRLKAHFRPMPSPDDITSIQVAEAEIWIDFEPRFTALTEIELVQEAHDPVLLPGAMIYRRDQPVTGGIP